MTKLRVIVDPLKCQGFAACVRAAPNVFSLGLDQIAEVDESAPADRELLIKAAKSCPFAAVSLTDALTGTQVYPASGSSPGRRE